MYLLLLGIALSLLKYLEVGPVAQWSWWWVLAPYALASLWWAWADATGYTKRRAVDRIERRKQDRLNKQRAALGLLPRKPR